MLENVPEMPVSSKLPSRDHFLLLFFS